MESIAKLKWLCRRGTKELDYLLLAYLDYFYDSADQDEQLLFRDLLQCQDPELIHLLLGEQKPQSAEWIRVVEKIRNNPSISS